MADRRTLIVVKNDSNNAEKGILLTIAEDGNTLNLRRDSTYDAAGDLELAANVYNVSPFAGSAVDLGVTEAQMGGDGATLSWTTNQEVNIQLVARTLGAFGRATSRTLSPQTGAYVGAVTGGNNSALLEISEDGWIRPDFLQVGNWPASVRQLSAPTDTTFRYTSAEAVEVILRAAPQRAAGFEANFGERLTACIYSAEARIEAWCGRQFTAAQSTATARTFRVSTPTVIEVDDLDLSRQVMVEWRNTDQPAANWTVPQAFTRYQVGRFLRPARRRWNPQIGDDVKVTAYWGWPSIPPEVQDYAGRLAAAIFDSDSARAGLIGIGDGLAYGRTPGKDIGLALGHLRKVPVG